MYPRRQRVQYLTAFLTTHANIFLARLYPHIHRCSALSGCSQSTTRAILSNSFHPNASAPGHMDSPTEDREPRVRKYANALGGACTASHSTNSYRFRWFAFAEPKDRMRSHPRILFILRHNSICVFCSDTHAHAVSSRTVSFSHCAPPHDANRESERLRLHSPARAFASTQELHCNSNPPPLQRKRNKAKACVAPTDLTQANAQAAPKGYVLVPSCAHNGNQKKDLAPRSIAQLLARMVPQVQLSSRSFPQTHIGFTMPLTATKKETKQTKPDGLPAQSGLDAQLSVFLCFCVCGWNLLHWRASTRGDVAHSPGMILNATGSIKKRKPRLGNRVLLCRVYGSQRIEGLHTHTHTCSVV